MPVCSRCGVEKEQGAFRYKVKIATHETVCKQCNYKRTYAQYKEKRQKLDTGEISPAPKEHPSQKICKICLIERPLEDFPYDRVIDYYYPVCKQCNNSKRHKEDRSESSLLRDKGLKRCKICGEVKPIADFSGGLVCRMCKLPKRVCIECGKEFSGTGRRVYCSRECKEKHIRELHTAPEKVCAICGKKFHGIGVTCSRECSLKNKNIKSIAWQKDMRKHAKTGSALKLRLKVSKDIRNAMNGKKHGGYKRYLGCDIRSFRLWLEEHWLDGMNWDNYGEWHIDHHIPISSFDLTDDTQARICFNYRNQYPMWARDNIQKSNTLPEDYEKVYTMIENSLSHPI